MAVRDWFRTRLALRIYWVGLLQVIVVAAGFFALLEIDRRERESPVVAEERFLYETMAKHLEDAESLQRVIEGAPLEAKITVRDPRGSVLATTAGPDDGPCAPSRGSFDERRPPGEGRRPGEGPPHPRGDGPRGPHPEGPFHRGWSITMLWERDTNAASTTSLMCRSSAIEFPDGEFGRVEFRRSGAPPPFPLLPVSGFVLVVVGLSSWLLARSIGRPLRRLASAAQALGEGDLQARVNMKRRDELGEVARAFDEMAGRVSELVRAEKELIANVSHELRTPLARIRVALDLANEGDAEMARASLVDIAGDLDELERLISDVLTAARLDLGKGISSRGIPPLRREPIDMNELIDRSAARFRNEHPERPLVVDATPDLPIVDGDPVLLRRVVDNLLENAHKYTEVPGDSVSLVALPLQGSLVIEIVDSGIGIAEADLSGVFRPFFRVDRSRTRTTGGLGLGLALAKRIVEAHGGTITLDSTPNQGTRACVRLPIAAQNDSVSEALEGPTDTET